MSRLEEVTEQVKALKKARDILKQQYAATDYHKKKERNPQEVVPSSPRDEEIYKLLNAIQQLDYYVKKLQDEQLELMKKEE